MEKLLDIKKRWEESVLSDGEALDEVLEVLETAQPTLKKRIMETDGEDMTDEQALEMVWRYYHLNQYEKITSA